MRLFKNALQSKQIIPTLEHAMISSSLKKENNYAKKDFTGKYALAIQRNSRVEMLSQ